MRNSIRHFYDFGPFSLDVEKLRLRRDGQLVSLPPKAIEALLVLVRNPGKMLEREALMQAVWADTFVEDANLTVAISQLRKALGQSGETAEYIETIPRVGYRFVADVRERREQPAPLIIEKHTLSRTVIEEEETRDQALDVVPVAAPVVRTVPQSRLAPFPRGNLAKGLAGAALAVAVVTGLVLALRGMNRVRTPLAVKSIAVLPFRVLNTEAGNEHMGLGMADILITRLSNIREVNVRPTSAVMAFEEQNVDSISAGRKLNVDAILEGTIYRVNDRVRITARLVKVSDQSPIWAGEFEKPLQDELRVQDEIALQLVDALALDLSGGEKSALTKRYTENWDAYQLYLKGRHEWNKRSEKGMVEAERLFRNAIEKDPKFALAYVGLADTLGMQVPAHEAISAASKALELDPSLAEAHATLGFLNMFHNWEWNKAEDSLKKAIELNPGYATAHHWYATLLEIEGRNDQAKAEMRRALEINPLSYNFLADLGQTYYFNHEYDQAKQYCRQALEIYPDFIFAHKYLSDVYLQTGEYDRAFEEHLAWLKTERGVADYAGEMKESNERWLTFQRDLYKKRGMAGYLDIRAGCITPQVAPADMNANTFYGRAGICSFLGEKERALDSLEQAYHNKAFLLVFVKADPIFDNLRAEPRYQAILKNMGL